jgi:hypothetical protein
VEICNTPLVLAPSGLVFKWSAAIASSMGEVWNENVSIWMCVWVGRAVQEIANATKHENGCTEPRLGNPPIWKTEVASGN